MTISDEISKSLAIQIKQLQLLILLLNFLETSMQYNNLLKITNHIKKQFKN